MERAEEDRSRLIAELRRLIDTGAENEGTTPSPFPGLEYFRASSPRPRAPMLLDPTLCVVASGEKKAMVGDETYTYDSGTYRVLAVPLPVDIESTRASVQDPLLAIALDIDVTTLTEVVLEMEDGPSQRVSRALSFIREHYTEPLDVDTIARAAYMSPSALHHDLKAVTSTSPTQYLKHIRLQEARLLMLRGDRTAAGAGRAVGYRSAPQFGRGGCSGLRRGSM